MVESAVTGTAATSIERGYIGATPTSVKPIPKNTSPGRYNVTTTVERYKTMFQPGWYGRYVKAKWGGLIIGLIILGSLSVAKGYPAICFSAVVIAIIITAAMKIKEVKQDGWNARYEER